MASNAAEFSGQIAFYEADGTTPISMTGKTLEAWIMKPADEPGSSDDDPVVILSTVDGSLVIEVSPADNVVGMTIDTDAMKTLTPGVYPFDVLEIVSAVTPLKYVSWGQYELNVRQGFTRNTP